MFQKIPPNSQQNTCVEFSFSNKTAGLRPTTFLKKTSTQVFFFEFFEIFVNTFFYRILPGDCVFMSLGNVLKVLYLVLYFLYFLRKCYESVIPKNKLNDEWGKCYKPQHDHHGDVENGNSSQ